MKKSFFLTKSRFIFLCCLGIVATVYNLLFFIIGDLGIKAFWFFGVIYITIFLFGFIVRSGTVVFGDKEFIIKKTIFHRKRYYKYDNIEKIGLLFYNTGGGRYGHGEPTVEIYFKKVKKACAFFTFLK